MEAVKKHARMSLSHRHIDADSATQPGLSSMVNKIVFAMEGRFIYILQFFHGWIGSLTLIIVQNTYNQSFNVLQHVLILHCNTFQLFSSTGPLPTMFRKIQVANHQEQKFKNMTSAQYYLS